ncbi:NACHT domain-containing protein [Saccharothrix syringae]|uniref:NACHT domain-containing protein n=1 Tax=Saccharothrix syringae TaxID=103733 RepID=UPI0005243C05|nr:NACHT domain-containing protein [Saccharothrix syringae]
MHRDDEARTTNLIRGDPRGPTVQASVINGDLHFHAQPAPPAPRQAGTWDDAAALPHAARSLLHAQVQAAEDLPHHLPGARRPSLAAVYVRQDLGGSTDEPRPEPPQPILDGHGQLVEVPAPPVARVAVRPPARAVREALDTDRHLVVVGGAGQGKSTLSLRLAADIASRWLAGGDEPLTEPVVPLRVTARELAARRGVPFPEALADSARADYGSLLHAPLSADLLADRVAGCRWLLLVDGLDEVADADDRDRLVKALARCAADSPYRVVLMTRPVEGGALAPLHRVGAVRYELQPFDEEALRRFARNWFTAEGPADRFLRQIHAAHLDELVRVPLLATIAAVVFDQRGDRPLPDNQYELYEAYLAFLRSDRAPSGPFEQYRTPLLEHLGRVRLESDTSLREAATTWVRTHLTTELPGGWAEELTAFLASVGPLVLRNDDLRFLHHSFAEHLAATAHARNLPTAFAPEETFVRLLHAARPRERGRFARAVALHYCRLRPAEADPMLRWLHAGDGEQHLLAARLLAKRLPASPEVVQAFLGTARGWAMTNQYPAAAILSQVSRATGHPWLAEWLVGLMRDADAPWASRTEAATALAVRLRGQEAPEAVAFLTALVDDEGAAVSVRLAAAEGLSETGADEREAAERGLRSVLADPNASGRDCHTAAVILSAFDPEANRDAVAALTGLLDDPGTPTQVVVEAATGLVEIGPDHHARAAEAFRAVLRDPVRSQTGREGAALGMAQLGPDLATEAVEALTHLAQDTRRVVSERVNAAEVLGRLGFQQRNTAGELVLAIMDEPGATSYHRRYCAGRLAEFGPAFRERAERELRSITKHPGTTVNDVMHAANALGKLGPEYFAEAASALWPLVDELRPAGTDQVIALNYLLDLGEPHRTSALRQIRGIAAERGATTNGRRYAVSRLIRSGPRFHAEARDHLLDIATTALDAAAALEAWGQLRELDTTFHDRALAALLVPANPLPDPINVFPIMSRFASSDVDRVAVADVLLAIAADPARHFSSRLPALNAAVPLGRAFHRAVVDQACDLLRSTTVPEFDFPYLAGYFKDFGPGLRGRVAEALHELLRSPETGAGGGWRVVRALEVLGFARTPAVRDALRALVDDGSAAPSVRYDATAMLASLHPDAVADAPVPEDDVPPAWTDLVLRLAALGTDVVPGLNALLADRDTAREVRVAAAAALLRLEPEGHPAALEELRRQAGDVHLNRGDRSDAFLLLTELHEPALPDAVAFHRDLAEREDEDVRNRAWAATDLVSLDRSAAPMAVGVLRRLCDNPHTIPADRASCVSWLGRLSAHVTLEPHLVMAVARHPASTGKRASMLRQLPRALRTEVEREVLDDRVLQFADRLPDKDYWDDLPLAAEAEAAARDALAAPESSARERVEAASALASLSTRLVPEAARVLRGLPTTSRGRHALARLGNDHFRRVLAEVESVAVDAARPLRERIGAANVVIQLTTTPPQSLVGLLRDVLADPRSSGRDRVDALYRLRRVDGLDPLRRLRDQEAGPVAARWRAAMKLVDFDCEDRAAAVRLLAATTADRAARPALRVHVADDLKALGEAGRQQAITLLAEMVVDAEVPVSARARAASILISVAPAARRDALAVLDDLLSTPSPLLRRQVWQAIGAVRPTEAALGLLATARNRDLTPTARVRCAETAVDLRRECRDAAAVVVREMAFDDTVPGHVRRRAARALARWSEVCRAEARHLLPTL